MASGNGYQAVTLVAEARSLQYESGPNGQGLAIIEAMLGRQAWRVFVYGSQAREIKDTPMPCAMFVVGNMRDKDVSQSESYELKAYRVQLMPKEAYHESAIDQGASHNSSGGEVDGAPAVAIAGQGTAPAA